MDNNVIIQALLLLPGISRKTIYKFLMDVDKLADDALSLFEQFYLFSKSTKFSKSDFFASINQAESIIRKSEDKGIQAISILDTEFPSNFRKIDDPPVLIYVKGNIQPFIDAKNVAIIGTREPTKHGVKAAQRLGVQFTQKGCNIVSGLATGCDTFGHMGCLEVNGKTAAIMPGGVDFITPVSNKDLAKEILEKDGVLISEYRPGTKPFRSFYVDRDRLQSALSEAVVVVETDIQGGTMHTVNFSIQQNKILACYKHPDKHLFENQTRGNTMLIKEKNAIPINDESTIIEIINLIENQLSLKKRTSDNQVIKIKEEQVKFL